MVMSEGHIHQLLFTQQLFRYDGVLYAAELDTKALQRWINKQSHRALKRNLKQSILWGTRVKIAGAFNHHVHEAFARHIAWIKKELHARGFHTDVHGEAPLRRRDPCDQSQAHEISTDTGI